MTLGLLYIMISLLLNDQVQSVFEVIESPNRLSWKTALHHCNNSRINFTVAVPAVNLTRMRVIDNIALKGEAWVGYFQSYEHFRFIVCVPLSEIESSVSAQYSTGGTENRPGMCYSLCGLQGYIGLQGEFCYCIATRKFSTPDTLIFNSSCEKPVPCGNGMLCGHQGYNNISVYMKVSISSSDNKGNGSGCFIFTNNKEYEMSVVNCRSSYRHLCEGLTGQILQESPEHDQWVHSIRDCARVGKSPTTYTGGRTNFVFPNASGSWWTSVVRDLVIQNYSESRTIQGTPLYEGFLKNSNEGIRLEFVHAGHSSRKKFVACMSDLQSTSTDKSTSFTTPIETTRTATNKIQTGTTTTSITSKIATSTSVTTDITLVLAVGVPSTSLLVISVLLNVYFIRKRLSMQIETTKELQYVTPMTHEIEGQRYDTISVALSTEVRSIPEIHSNISTSTASYTLPGQDHDGYLTPVTAGSNVAYDYVE